MRTEPLGMVQLFQLNHSVLGSLVDGRFLFGLDDPTGA